MAMENRELPDWLSEFVENSKWGEAPIHMYFWVGVATIAAALRRKVWIDMGTFIWRPNLYTLIVAPPGIVSKSSTADLGMRLLRAIPEIRFGPSTLTWQALYDAFVEVGEEFEVSAEEVQTQFPLVINSSEFGITLNTKDTEMIDQLVHIWDGAEMRKRTRKDGELRIPTPSLNIIACTTPDWIANNFSQYIVGGGLTSRMLFVYADEKSKYIAYPQDHMPSDYPERQARLTRDLERMAQLVGKFTLTKQVRDWGQAWYEDFHRNQAKKLDATLIGGYIARKQTLVHKVAMILAVSRGNSLVIDLPILERAVALLDELEKTMPKVYSRMGSSQDSQGADQVLSALKRYGGKMPFSVLYRAMHKLYPDSDKFDKILIGLQDAGYIGLSRESGMVFLVEPK